MSKASFATPIALDRDTFMRRLIASLGHLNEGILGSDVAGAYAMNVGLSMGAAIEAEYKRFWGIDRPFTVDEYAHVIVDLKQKIRGNFSVVSTDPERVVVRTTSCPFDEFVRQSPSLCFMTSSVFGGIAARSFGYAKVVLHQRIALGDPGCYVTVYLKRTPEAEAAIGREYFPDIDRASPDIGEQLQIMESLSTLRRQLSEAHSRWEELVHAAAEAICALSPDGGIILANARWRDILGVESEELVGGQFARIVHPDDELEVSGTIARALRNQRVIGHKARLRHRDGSWRDASISAGPIRDERGETMGVLAIVRDVTAERETERLKDVLISTTSHELRTPVTTIKGLAQVLLRSLERGDELDPDQFASRLQTIVREADRLTALGADLSDVARLRSGGLTAVREETDLSQLVDECLQRQRELVNGKTPHRITAEQPGAPVLVAIDRPRIEQVITNLVDNAVKYSPDGGDITVRTSIEGGAAVVRVADQGIGIPAQDRAKIFTPFFRSSNASARNFVGLGLGLHLSKAVIEAHGGEIAIESVEGQGTTASFSLPLAADQPA